MKGKKTFIGLALFVAVLVLGIGYALVSSQTLNINGEAKAGEAEIDFPVMFDDSKEIVVSDTDKVEASIDLTDSNKRTATINVSGLTAIGDKVTATYAIKNESTDLAALLSAETNSVSDYFKVTAAFEDDTIAPQDFTNVTLTVELAKTPIDQEITSAISAVITATPVQPAE